MKRGTYYVMIRGLRWKFIYGRPPANDCIGYCVIDDRKIWVRPRKGSNIRLTAIHETLHAALPDLEEETISQTAEAIDEVLILIETK